MNAKPTYTGKARYFSTGVAFTWSGTEGTLSADSGSLIFEDGDQQTVIPFHDIRKIWFDFGKRDYLRIKKTDDTSCFFILEAKGSVGDRVAQYKPLEHILSRNGLDSNNSLDRAARFLKHLQQFRRISWIIPAIVFVIAIIVSSR
jgi:hypothetical protein